MARIPREIRDNELMFRLKALGRFPYADDEWFQNGIDQQMVDDDEMEREPTRHEDPDRHE
jgi:hypothetical protein